MKILIADTDPNIRYGLRSITDQVEDRIILGEATDSHQLFKSVIANCPDVLLISQVFPGLENGRLLARLHQICNRLVIIILIVNLPGRIIKIPVDAKNKIKVIQKPEHLLEVLNEISLGHVQSEQNTGEHVIGYDE